MAPFVCVLIPILAAGCGDDGDACVPGASVSCTGPAACMGAQVCADDGTRFGACECADLPMPDASLSRDQGVGDGGAPGDAAADSGDAALDDDVPEELKAFPGAYGAGAYITGGRGGQVIAVTRLDDAFDESGEPVEGTLRYAITRPFPRTVVFRVSGSIVIGDTDGDGRVDREARFPTMLYLSGEDLSDLTVAGQTAPRGGVTVVGYVYGGGVRNMIWRYVRFRKPWSPSEFGFPAFSQDGSDDIVVDHLSVAYGSNESLSFGPRQDHRSSRSTAQFNLVARGNASSIFGRISDGELDAQLSFHNNFMTHLTHRTPNIAGDVRAEVINNLVYDWAFRLVNVHNAARVNHIANVAIAGPRTSAPDAISNKVHTGTSGSEDAQIYSAQNYISGYLTEPDADNWFTWTAFPELGSLSNSRQVLTPFEALGSPIPIRSVEAIREQLPDEVGAFRTLDENGEIQVYRDALDALYIADYRAGTESVYGYPASEEELVLPEIPSNTPYADTDGDGMPDAWERSMGFEPERADDAEDADEDGYTNLEEFLNLVDR